MNKEIHTLYQKAAKALKHAPGVFFLDETENYMNVIYKGYKVYLQENMHGTDDNHPGPVLFMVKQIRKDGNSTIQASYWEEFKDMSSVDTYIQTHEIMPVPNAPAQPLDFELFLKNAHPTDVIRRVVKKEGNRQDQALLDNGFFLVKSDTWNEHHKIVDVLSLFAGEDGCYSGFHVDLVTKSICG